MLKRGGQKALAEQLEKMKKKGNLSLSSGKGADIVAGRFTTLPSGERVIWAVSNRALFFETLGGVPTIAGFPLMPSYTVMKIRVDSEGNGSGTMFAGAQLKFGADGGIEIGFEGAQVFNLLGVTSKPAR